MMTLTPPKGLVKFQVLMEKSPIWQLSVGPDQKSLPLTDASSV